MKYELKTTLRNNRKSLHDVTAIQDGHTPDLTLARCATHYGSGDVEDCIYVRAPTARAVHF